MRSRSVWLASVTAIALLLAGCVGQFEVRQTEPLRIQLEGEGAEARISAEDGEDGVREREFVVVRERTEVTQVVKVNVQARQTSSQPATVVVIVRDQDTNETLQQETVQVENTTTSTLTVNVEGDRNIVVITQALDGSAVVNVTANTGDEGDADAGATGDAQGLPDNGLPDNGPPANATAEDGGEDGALEG